jgi:hypothetical protein
MENTNHLAGVSDDELADEAGRSGPDVSTALAPRHPARYTEAILAAVADIVACGSHVHDCYAGTGERLGRLADRHGWTFTGTEIEASFIVDQRVAHGDATDPITYPTTEHVIITSPAYPNGMADDFAAANPTKRNTYRAAIHRIEGADRRLHPNSMGQYGYRPGRRVAEKKAAYWRLARATVTCWTASRVLVNVKDFIHSKGVVEPVVEPWAELLAEHGYRVADRIVVETSGQRFGANRHRVDHEVILVGVREVPR